MVSGVSNDAALTRHSIDSGRGFATGQLDLETIRAQRAAGLCGLDTSIDAAGLRLSSAITMSALSGESAELPQLTLTPDFSSKVIRSGSVADRVLAFLRSDPGKAEPTMATSRSRPRPTASSKPRRSGPSLTDRAS